MLYRDFPNKISNFFVCYLDHIEIMQFIAEKNAEAAALVVKSDEKVDVFKKLENMVNELEEAKVRGDNSAAVQAKYAFLKKVFESQGVRFWIFPIFFFKSFTSANIYCFCILNLFSDGFWCIGWIQQEAGCRTCSLTYWKKTCRWWIGRDSQAQRKVLRSVCKERRKGKCWRGHIGVSRLKHSFVTFMQISEFIDRSLLDCYIWSVTLFHL